MAQESRYVFNRNVSHGVKKDHTHYKKGMPVPQQLEKEMKSLGFVELAVKEKLVDESPEKTKRVDPPKEGDDKTPPEGDKTP